MGNYNCSYDFGRNSNGEAVKKYMIQNSRGMGAMLTDLGAAVVSLFVPGKDGMDMINVSLNYDNPLSYEKETTYFGAVVAPYANRIADAKVEIDGKTYELDANNNENTLHSGFNSLAKKIWRVKEHSGERTANKLVFTYDAKNLEQGFPGNIHYEVCYEVTDYNELAISYYAVSDQKTILNMTNHTYFNLSGACAGSVEDHELWIKASYYTPVKDEKAIPTGELAPVEGTPFDFRVPKTIGQDIQDDFAQLIFGQGYDHNFVIDKETDGIEKIATAYSPKTGIQMDVWTDCIGVQLYTGNFMAGQVGPEGHVYEKHAGFCLETQYFPNCAKEPNFVCPWVEANVPYESKTIYAFSCPEKR